MLIYIPIFRPRFGRKISKAIFRKKIRVLNYNWFKTKNLKGVFLFY